MRLKGVVKVIFLIMALGLTLPLGVEAVVEVGCFTKVMGPVDLQKGGIPPTLKVKVQDGVAPGDLVRTQHISRAQLKFVDDSCLTISPDSQVIIEEYLYDNKKKERYAVCQVLRGLVHSLISPMAKTDKPSFYLKTHTAVMAIRGTSTYIAIKPDGTYIYNESGRVRVSNIMGGVKGDEELGEMQYSRVEMGRPPTAAASFTEETLNQIKDLLGYNVPRPEDDRGFRALCTGMLGLATERAWLLDWLMKFCGK